MTVEYIKIADLIFFFKKYFFKVFIIAFLSAIVTYGITKFLPKSYKATVSLIPLYPVDGGNDILNAVLGVSTGLSQAFQNPYSNLTAIFLSRSVAENVVSENNLLPHIFKNKWDSENNKWKDEEKIPTPTEGALYMLKKELITYEQDPILGVSVLEIELDDPIIAMSVANSYIKIVRKFIYDNTFSLTKENRLFLEKQLAETKIKYINISKVLMDYYNTNNVSSVSDISNIAEGLNASDAGINPDILKKVPQKVQLDYLLVQKAVLGSLMTSLSSQLEAIRSAELKEVPQFTVLDSAILPKKHSHPKELLLSAVAFVFSSIVAFLIYFIKAFT